MSDSRGTLNITKHKFSSITFFTPNSSAIFTSSYTVKLTPGIYVIEAWGSAGSAGVNGKTPGKGAYVKGSIVITRTLTLYLFVGNNMGYNSVSIAKSVQCYGGGASDVRLTNGEWNDFESLKSRILIASGGGGAEWSESIGGHGGQNGTQGYWNSYYANGGTQTSGGEGSKNMNFQPNVYRDSIKGGFGDIGEEFSSNDYGGMGGGGYYTGASMDYTGAGGGGSSFISGHQYCDAIDPLSTKNKTIHTKQSIHYSKLAFYETMIITGNTMMPSFLSYESFQGNDDLGAIRITLIRSLSLSQKCRSLNLARVLLFYMIALHST